METLRDLSTAWGSDPMRGTAGEDVSASQPERGRRPESRR